MRILFIQITLLLALSVALAAQDNSKSELYGGIQFGHYGSVHTWDPFSGLPADSNNASVNVNDIGFNIAYTHSLNRSLGITADFSSGLLGGPTAQEGVGGTMQSVSYHLRIFNLAIGPEYSFNTSGNLKPFVHVLFGGGYATGSACSSGVPCTSLSSGSHYGVSTGGVVAYIGGGVDKKLKNKLSFRGQFDWFYNYGEYNSGMGNVRLSGGVVYHF